MICGGTWFQEEGCSVFNPRVRYFLALKRWWFLLWREWVFQPIYWFWLLVDPKRMPSLPKMSSLVFRFVKKEGQVFLFPPKKGTSMEVSQKKLLGFCAKFFDPENSHRGGPWPFLEVSQFVVFSTMGLVSTIPGIFWGSSVTWFRSELSGFLALWKKVP